MRSMWPRLLLCAALALAAISAIASPGMAMAAGGGPLQSARHSTSINRAASAQIAGCFPSNSIWEWSNSSRTKQAYVLDDSWVSGDRHFNIHVQVYCGRDYNNWHLRYVGVINQSYTWEISDSVTGFKKQSQYSYFGDPYTAADTVAWALAGTMSDAAGATNDGLGTAFQDYTYSPSYYMILTDDCYKLWQLG